MMNRSAQTVPACAVLLTALLTLLLAGCGSGDQKEVKRILVSRGGEQCALPGKDFGQMLQLRLDGPDGAPVAGQAVRFEVQPGSDLRCSPERAVSDAGGIVMTRVTAGKKIGDQYLLAMPESRPERAAEIRFVTGVEMSGVMQEGRSGTMLDDPIRVRLVGPAGKPVSGAKVFFKLVSEPKGAGARLTAASAVTGADGIASCSMVLGNKTGKYNISIDITGLENTAFRPLTVGEMGLDLNGLLVGVAGGLALFIFGMKLMSGGLQTAAGERMRGLLRFFASNRYVAILAGAVVTAVLQSSSASTVMVIGFINAGLLSLLQAIGIIFGANIGTTMTAQLVAFNLDGIIMPAIISGLAVSFIKWHPLRGWGDMLLGFGLLFFGMKIMSSELKIIADFPSFVNFFRSFDCAPVNGVIPPGALIGAIMIGVLVTMMIQSSLATAGIVIALGAGGLVNLYTAVALVLGSNIGTTITALLAALPANRVAKQAALAHTLFNVIGVLIIAGTFWIPWGHTGVPMFFYIVNKFTDGNAFAAIPQNMPRHIANAHTLFNVFTTLILIPFIPLLAKICERLLPVGDAKVRYQYLEPNLIHNPAIALDQTVMVLRRMLRKAWNMVDRSLSEHFMTACVDEEKFEQLDKREKRIDSLQMEITDYLTRVMQKKLSGRQATVIPLLMHCTNDAERIGDHTEVIIGLTRRLAESGNKLSSSAVQELSELRDKLNDQAGCALQLLEHYDEKMRLHAMDDQREISEMVKRFENTHIARLKDRTCNASTGVIFIEALGEIEKVSARLSNIVDRSQAINLRSASPAPVRKPEPEMQTES